MDYADKYLDPTYGPNVTNVDPDLSNLQITKSILVKIPNYYIQKDYDKDISNYSEKIEKLKIIEEDYNYKIKTEQLRIENFEKRRQKERRDFLYKTHTFRAEKTPYLYSNNPTLCCDERERDFIISMADDIKKIPKYSSLSDEDIYKVILNYYYSSRAHESDYKYIYPEKGHHESKDFGNIYPKLDYTNKKLSTELANDILMRDISINGINIFSLIRKEMNGLTNIKKGKLLGGRKHTKRRKTKKSKRTKKFR
jgi:hypothetical protein